MINDAYSSAKIRRSLLHFLTGKMASALLGFMMLLLLVRLLSRQEYGGYIALLAVFELLQLSSNFGCFAAAFRYVPELRANNHLQSLRRLIIQLLLFRGATLGFCALLLAVCAPYFSQWLGMPWMLNALRLYSVVLLFEGFARYTDVLFDSLLLQGYAQISIILRNGLRVLCLLLFATGFLTGTTFDIFVWIIIEALASFSGLVVAIFLLMKSLRTSKSVSESKVFIDYARIWQYSGPAFLAQVLGLAQGIDVVKLLIAKMFDAIQIGAFGFAAAINSMMQRYLPVFLLIGMIRPLFISARERGLSNNDLVGMAALIFKLNLFVLMPMSALIAVIGTPVMDLLSGGKFPEAGVYLFLLILLLMFQTLHSVMGLLALVVEESVFGLLGTLFGLLGIVIGITLSYWMGPLALCVGLIISELLWCLTMQYALLRHNIAFRVDFKSILKLIFGAGVSAIFVYLEWSLVAIDNLTFAVALSVLTGIIVFLLTMSILKPFLDGERAMINRALPRPLFIW